MTSTKTLSMSLDFVSAAAESSFLSHVAPPVPCLDSDGRLCASDVVDFLADHCRILHMRIQALENQHADLVSLMHEEMLRVLNKIALTS